MANSADPDQTPRFAACSRGVILFAQAYLFKYLGSIRWAWKKNNVRLLIYWLSIIFVARRMNFVTSLFSMNLILFAATRISFCLSNMVVGLCHFVFRTKQHKSAIILEGWSLKEVTGNKKSRQKVTELKKVTQKKAIKYFKFVITLRLSQLLCKVTI